MLAPTHALVLYSPTPSDTVRFYTRLGWRFRKVRRGRGPAHWTCDHGGFVVEIYRATMRFTVDGAQTGSRFVIPVPDIDRAIRTAVEGKGTVVVGPKDTGQGRAAIIADPEGRHVLLIGPP